MISRILPPLYLITNRHQTRERPLEVALDQALQAGVRFVQLREKDLDTRRLLSLASDILTLTRSYKAILLINDRVDIVKAIGADGVHLRSGSLPVVQARQILGSSFLIGKSTHSEEEVVEAEADGADFAVLGPIYDTPSKRRLGDPLGCGPLQEVRHRCHIPVYAIGGITPTRASQVLVKGAYGVAVISFVLEAESIPLASSQLLQVLGHS